MTIILLTTPLNSPASAAAWAWALHMLETQNTWPWSEISWWKTWEEYLPLHCKILNWIGNILWTLDHSTTSAAPPLQHYFCMHNHLHNHLCTKSKPQHLHFAPLHIAHCLHKLCTTSAPALHHICTSAPPLQLLFTCSAPAESPLLNLRT